MSKVESISYTFDMTKIQNMYVTVDIIYLITSAKAENLGMSNDKNEQDAKDKLICIGCGVY